MIFGDKKNSKRTAQLKSVLEDAVDEALKRQARELARQQEGQNAYLSEGIEKNQKAIRSLADTVEDFLDTLQEQAFMLGEDILVIPAFAAGSGKRCKAGAEAAGAGGALSAADGAVRAMDLGTGT